MEKSSKKSRRRTLRRNRAVVGPVIPPPAVSPAQALPTVRKGRSIDGYSRVLWLYEELKAGAVWNTTTLMAEMGVSESTVRRALANLRVLFKQTVLFDVEANTFYLPDRSKPLPHASSTRGELLMLCLAREALAPYAGTSFDRTLQDLIARQAASLDKRLEGSLADLTANISFRTLGGKARCDPTIFDAVAAAQAARCEILFDYRPQNRKKYFRVRVRPRYLVQQDTSWYLLAHSCKTGKGRAYALSRMAALERTAERFERETGPTLLDALKHSIGIFGGEPERVRIRLRGAAARIVDEQLLHDSQELRECEKDEIELVMHVAVNEELERWILGWAELAEVLEPAKLVEAVADRAEKQAAQYRRPRPEAAVEMVSAV